MASESMKTAEAVEFDQPASPKPICGIVRPIAAMGEAYPATHWLEVHDLIAEAADRAGYNLRLVSESDQVGIIVSQIVTNLFNDPIVICDVSGRNPNVMFELGMRITFQKPVIIITDDETPFTFDISAIGHLQYRRDLRLGPTRKFQQELTRAITATVQASSDPQYRDYLQQFGPIQVTGLRDQEVDLASLAASVRDIGTTVQAISQRLSTIPSTVPKPAVRSSGKSTSGTAWMRAEDAQRLSVLAGPKQVVIGEERDGLVPVSLVDGGAGPFGIGVLDSLRNPTS